jgi:hypothetical protein
VSGSSNPRIQEISAAGADGARTASARPVAKMSPAARPALRMAWRLIVLRHERERFDVRGANDTEVPPVERRDRGRAQTFGGGYVSPQPVRGGGFRARGVPAGAGLGT